MANVNSISSNSYSSGTSLYGSRNVLTGLASGMDTEAMIQNSVSGYQTKITQLQQSQTKLEWKQDAYRDLTDQMNSIVQKYTSYTSKTNLASNAFFTNSTTTTANGNNASAISATGKSTSDIQINAVTKLATSARYAVDAKALGLSVTEDAAGGAIDWGATRQVGQVKGTMTLKYGNQTVELNFDESDADLTSADKLKEAIEKKLADVTVTTAKGSAKASELFNVGVSGNTFSFSANEGNAAATGDSVYINSVSGNLSSTLGATKPASTGIQDRLRNMSFTVDDFDALSKTQTTAEYLSGKSVEVTLDGATKTVKIGELAAGATTADLAANLQAGVDAAFGSGKVTVGVDGGTGGLRFDPAAGSGSTLRVASSAGEALGIGKSGVSNYFNTGNTLKDLLGTDWLNANARVAAAEGSVESKEADGETQYFDSEGNRVARLDDDPAGAYYRVDDKGSFLYSMEVNGVKMDGFTEDSAMDAVMNTINNSSAGVRVSYSNLTSQFVFTSTETGAGSKIEFGDGLAARLFDANATRKSLSETFGTGNDWSGATVDGSTLRGAETLSDSSTLEDLRNVINNAGFSFKIDYDQETNGFSFVSASDGSALENFDRTIRVGDTSYSMKSLFATVGGMSYTEGQDAEIEAVVNGQQLTLKRSSNVVNMDGMNVTLKEEFDARQYGEDGQLLRNSDGSAKVSKSDAVTFTTSTNADSVVETIKAFVDDVNKLMNDVHSAYSTQPLKKSSSSRSGYEPLTEEDKADMSESAVKAYEEKAKTGLLFGDTDLSQLYNKLLSNIQATGSDREALKAIGITTSYSSGVTTLTLNENDLRAALDSDPDKVRNAFTKTTEGGSATNGLMASLKQTLSAYGSTSLATPGILVRKAGSKLSALSLLNNSLQSQIDNVSKQIENWQTKLSSKIDYYTKQFTALEKLMSTMNNQSSMLSGLMGY